MNKKVIIPIIASVIALLVIVGVSYAYYTSSITGSNTTANIVTATIGNVEYTTTTPTGTSILPGWTGEGTTSVYLTSSSDRSVNYHCTVSLTNDSYSNNIYIQTTSGADAQVPSMTALTTSGVTVSEGTLAPETFSSGTGTAHNVTYNIIFNETGQAQNEDKTQTIKVQTSCIINDSTFSVNTVLSGTVYDENNQPLVNQPMVAFSDPTYFMTDNNGHYEVTLPSGNHEIYYVPSVTTMEALEALGDTVKTNENVKTVEINTDITTDISFVKYTISATCTGCTLDTSSKQVGKGQTGSFTVTANENYTLEGATVTGGCTLSNGKLTITNVHSSVSCSVTAEPLYSLLVDKILIDNPTVSTRTNFNSGYTANTTGTIFTTDRTEDGSTVYYYAGNTHNNWVIFGNNGSGTYYYWRIIRTNSTGEGGGVRLLYSGSGSSNTTIPDDVNNAIAISGQYFNNASGNETLGYMYTAGSQHGNQKSSIAKNQLESWYISSGLNDYDYLVNKNAVYCNDRSIASGTWTSSSIIDYASVVRNRDNKYPTYKCGGNISGGYYENATNRLADRFSVNTNGGGNGLLSKAIALMTFDEAVFAGSIWNAGLSSPYAWHNNNPSGSSIVNGTTYWLMTPAFTSSNGKYMATVYNPAYLIGWGLGATHGLRPVISLNSNVYAKGEGTSSKPYLIDISNKNSINSNRHTVSVTCTNCSSNFASLSVVDGETVNFNIVPNSGYTLSIAEVSGGCSLNGNNLTATNVINDLACTVTAKLTSCNVYCTNSSNCTPDRSARNGDVYAVFTCNNVTKKTGSINSCWYQSTECDGGSAKLGANFMCTSSISNDYGCVNGYAGNLQYSCKAGMSYNGKCSLGLSGSNYSCSCD